MSTKSSKKKKKQSKTAKKTAKSTGEYKAQQADFVYKLPEDYFLP